MSRADCPEETGRPADPGAGLARAIAAAAASLPELRTDRLLLRQLRSDDAEAMFAYAGDPLVTENVRFATHRDVKDAEAAIAGMLRRQAAGDQLEWGITLQHTDRLIGTCGFNSFRTPDRCAVLGCILNRAFWNQGLMTEAVRAVIRFGFETLGLNRIEASCFTSNPGSARVMEKSGMVFEGILREHVLAKGRFRDGRLYSVLHRDWQAAQQPASPNST